MVFLLVLLSRGNMLASLSCCYRFMGLVFRASLRLLRTVTRPLSLRYLSSAATYGSPAVWNSSAASSGRLSMMLPLLSISASRVPSGSTKPWLLAVMVMPSAPLLQPLFLVRC